MNDRSNAGDDKWINPRRRKREGSPLGIVVLLIVLAVLAAYLLF